MLKHGFSLTELLIALALGGLVVSAAATVSSRLIIRVMQLEQRRAVEEVSALLAFSVSKEIRRSGYWFRPLSLTDSANPFLSQWHIDAYTGEPDASCVLLAYDKNKDGELTLDSPAEQTGFRLRDGALEQRVNGHLCDQKGWQDITDTSEMTVDTFSVRVSPLSPNVAEISLALHHKQTPAIRQQRVLTVALPNH
ncbi:prepilin-type N-terminal cleavage/methylation domain-containing protein [Alteromonas sp. CYL-A6]|uniref:prepilin-type N-terminal cleavage/methylation domain-containing protein n=1 Tax=Alteromonas nitratireducens TaxID=3390813 RepID=UPI0034AB4BBE